MPILRGPNWGLPFHIHMDVSYYAIGAILGQKIDSIKHVIYFISNTLQGVEFNYIVTRNELIFFNYALHKFRHYITRYEIFVHIDHIAIKYLVKKPTIL